MGNSVTFATKKQILTVVERTQYTAALSMRGINLQKAHVKGDAAPYNTCTKWSANVDGDGLLQLTGLTANTDYTYRAYEDSACATELAQITFTTYGTGLTLSELGTTTVTLKIVEHTGQWYYKADKAPHNTCKGPVPAGTATKDLAGLTAGTLYVYRAYSDSACATTRLAFVQFYTKVTGATPEMTVSYVGPTTAKLTISGHREGGSWLFSADGYESGHCLPGGEAGDRSIEYLAGLTPGKTYTFTAYYFLNPTHFLSSCAFEMATATFTTPAQLPQCDGLSLEVRHDPSRSSGEWFFNYIVSNNTATAIHDIRLHKFLLSGDFYDAGLLHRRYAADHTITELKPYATVGDTVRERLGAIVAGNSSMEMNVIMQLMAPDDPESPVCETLADPIWPSSLSGNSSVVVRGGNFGISSMQLDNPLAGANENATFTITAYADTTAALTQACVNLRFDGLTQVDADGDGHHDVVIYDGPNGKYQEDGTLNVDSGNTPLGYARAGRLEYDSDGYDEDAASPRYRPQCSDAAGNFQGGLFRIGDTRIGTDSSSHKWPAGVYFGKTYYTVKVPVTRTGAGPGCVTATMGALPAEITDNVTTAYEKSRDNTATACLGPPPSGDPELPVLLQEGRADLLTMHKCADGASFPCAGKSADDLVQYVDGSALAASGAGDAATGNAAENAGSPYRAFQTTDVVTHVADFTTTDSDDPVSYVADGGRAVRKHPTSPSKVVWYVGHDVADNPGDSNDFGILPGVSTKYRFLGPDYNRYALSICAKHDPQYLADLTKITPCLSTANQNPGTMRGLFGPSWTYVLFNMAGTQPTSNFNRSGLDAASSVFEFSTLGTYVADIIIATDYVNSPTVAPTGDSVKTVGRHTFHVGPAADLSVRAGGSSASVASGKRAFTIVSESEATPEIDTEFKFKDGIHIHYEKINLHTLIPAVAVTAGGAAIPAANISQAGATAGSYDTATGVWTLPEGFQGTAALTLVTDASAVSSVTAEIENSAEVCETAAGTVVTTVDGRAVIDHATCEFEKDGASSGNHWGIYQRCINTNASAVGLDPDDPTYISSETACTTNSATNTWHTTEVYDWRPNNNTVTFTPDARGFTLNARGAGRTSIDLRWAKQSGADDYAIYSASTADLTSTDNLGALLGANQLAVVPGNATTYYHDGLRMGEKRHYLIRARKDGRPIAMSNLAGATAEIPGEPWQAPPASRAPGAVDNLTAVRTASDENVISVVWDTPRNGASGYDVQYQSRPGGGSWSDWTNLSASQGERTYTFYNAGGGTSYRFQVRAFNTYAGQTNYGSWRTSGTVDPVSTPDQVRNLIAVRDTNDAAVINVSWKAPDSDSPPTGYDAQYRSRTGNSGAWGSWNIEATGQAGTSYTLATTTVANSYQFRVRAVTVSGGDTIYGSWRTADIVPAFDNPDQVRNLTATRNFTNETTINVTWDAPAAGVTPTGYGVEYQENGGDWIAATDNQADLYYDLTNAGGAKSYRFRVRALTKTADVTPAHADVTPAHADSDTVYGSWAYSNTVPRVAAPGQVSNLRAERQFADATKIDVTWTAPSNANSRTSYEVEYQQDGGAWTAATTTATTTYTLDPASGNSRYVFRVRGVTTLTNTNEKLEGSWRSSNTVSKVAAPNQVGNLRAARQFANEKDIVVTWTAPNNANSDTRYDVEYQQDGGAWTSANTALNTTTYEFNNQALGQSRYVFRARGVTTLANTNERLEGSWRSSNTVQKVPTPGQVGNLRATRNATNDTIIKVTWTAPGNATGATEYDLEYQEDGGAWTSDATDISTTTYQFSKATGANRYLFRVRAVTESDNSDLTGSWRGSNAVPVLPAPNSVSNVKATRDDANENRIVVTWTAPTSGTTPTGYEVQYKENNADWKPDTPTDVPGTTTAVFSDATIIKGGSRYQFQVRAYTTLNSGTKLRGGWRSSNNVAGLPAGNISTTTATRSASDPTTIDVVWTDSARATVGYQVQHRKNNGGWTNATTTGPNARSYTKTGVGGVETHTFRVRGISGAGNGAWTESNTVQPPPINYHGLVVGVDYVTIKMTSGPWYYDFRNHTGNWSGCKRVASGSHTLTSLWAETTYTVNLFSAQPDNCTRHDPAFMSQREFKTLSDINDTDKCWNADDCRDIDNPNDFNNHTHKRSRLAQSGNNLSNCDRVTHTHGWPNGGWGQHWHCRQ